jgi:hypothetical protein
MKSLNFQIDSFNKSFYVEEHGWGQIRRSRIIRLHQNDVAPCSSSSITLAVTVSFTLFLTEFFLPGQDQIENPVLLLLQAFSKTCQIEELFEDTEWYTERQKLFISLKTPVTVLQHASTYVTANLVCSVYLCKFFMHNFTNVKRVRGSIVRLEQSFTNLV